MRHTHTFVLKLLLDNEQMSRLHGQISQPASDDEWRASFADVNELLQQLLKRVAAAPGEALGDIAEIGHARERVESN